MKPKRDKTTKDKPKVELVTVGDIDWEAADCPICLAMQIAEKTGRYPTEKELIKLFKEAQKKGAIVGGTALEDL